MSKKRIEILTVINELKNNSVSQGNLNILVENSFRISLTFFYSKRLKVYKNINIDGYSN